jgi:O-antigen ligase
MAGFLQRNKYVLILFTLWYFVGSISVPGFYVLGLLSMLLMWRRSMYFELLLGFFFILILSDNLKYTTDFAKIFKNVYIVALGVIAFADRRKLQPFNGMFTYMVPFILVGGIALINSPDIVTGAQKTLSYLLLFFTVPQFFIKAFRQRGATVVKDFLFFGVIIILLGFAFRYIDPGVAFSHGGRFRGIFGNPNGLGIFASLMALLAVVGREYFKSIFAKNDLRWIFIAIIVAILMCGSRTSIIATFLFLVFIRFFRFSPAIGFILLLTLAVVVEAISSNIVGIVQGMGLSEYFRTETLQEGSGRYIAWQFAWDGIQDNFWLGRGFAFDEWLMDGSQELLNALGHQGGVHNTYLIIWLNTGLAGLLIFLRAIILLFVKASKNTVVATPALWLVLFSILLEPWLAASLNPFTILLIIALCIMTDDIFQPYIRGEIGSHILPETDATTN